jgi:hypothetical protein
MIEKVLVLILITTLVFFVYEFVKAVWTIDICLSYYQRYGDYNYTIPLTDKKITTFDCYHEGLNDLNVLMLAIVLISLSLGFLVSCSRDFEIGATKK